MKEVTSCALIGHELLLGIFNEFPKDKQLFFKTDLILVIYEASKKDEFKEFFENYSFDDDNPTDISSPEIEDGLHILLTAQLFQIIPPNQFYVLTKGISDGYKDDVQTKLTEPQLDLLKILALEIKQNILQ